MNHRKKHGASSSIKSSSGVSSNRKNMSLQIANQRKTRNTHFIPSSIGNYPLILLFMRYVEDEFKEKLILDPTHPIGKSNSIANFQYWSQLRETIEEIIEREHPCEEMNFTNSTECDDDLLEFILQSFLRKFLRKLILNNCQYLSLNGLLAICSFESLTALDLSHSELLTDSLLETITTSLKTIQHLTISSCLNLTDVSIAHIALTYNSNLISFACENNPHITHVSMNDLIMKCENLQRLNINSSSKVQFFGVVVHVRDSRLQYISRNLTHVSINHLKNLQYYSLCWISTALPMLEELSAESIATLDDHIVRSLVGACPLLLKLNLNGCRKVTLDIFQFFGSVYKIHLKELKMAKLNPSSALYSHQDVKVNKNSILHSFHYFLLKIRENLQVLDISENSFLIDDFFQYSLSSLMKKEEKKETNHHKTHSQQKPLPPYHSTKLKSLNVSFTSLTTLGIVSIVPNYPNLRILNLSGLKLVNDAGLQVVALSCKKLKVLSINGCVSLTDIGIITVVSYCKELIELNASYDNEPENGQVIGDQFTDDIWEAVFHLSRHLLRINFSNQLSLHLNSKWLKSSFIKYYYNYSIQSINLTGCMNLSTNLLQPLFLKFYHLNNLVLPHTFSEAKEIVSKKFWYQTFANSIYTKVFNQNEVEDQSIAIRQSLQIVVNTRKAGVPGGGGGGKLHHTLPNIQGNLQTGSSMRSTTTAGTAASNHALHHEGGDPSSSFTRGLPGNHKKNPSFYILQQHPLKSVYEYRDHYIQRRILEKFAIRVIQKAFYGYKIWKKFKKNIYSRKIAKRIFEFHEYKTFQRKLLSFTQNLAAKKIQRFIVVTLLQYNRAVNLLIRYYRQWKLRRQARLYVINHKKIIKIQARVRGMLVRLSERYILSQVYLKLPKFWKIVANYSNDEIVKRKKNYDPLNELNNSRPATTGKKKKGGSSEKNEGDGDSYLKSAVAPEKIKDLYYNPLLKSNIYDYEIDELKSSAQGMLSTIDQQKQSRQASNKPFAIALPIQIPQSFDVKPYVSLFDGRKLSYYSSTQSVFSSDFTDKVKNKKNFELSEESKRFLEGKATSPIHSGQHHPGLMDIQKKEKSKVTAEELTDNHLPIHVFQNKFYPLVHHKKRENIFQDLVLYNPMINNFEQSKNYHKPLYCQCCYHRLRMILCKTCSRGYCFFCGFQYHNSLIHKGHVMEFMEPRIVHVEKVSHSLLFHIENASNIMYDLRYVIRYLRTKAEIQKLNEEKKLLKEYERRQEQMRITILQAQQEYNNKQDNATRVGLLYRSYKAKKIVREKRLQLHLEKLLKENNKIFASILKFQVLYRRFTVRKWFFKKGIVFRGVPKYYKTITNKQGEKHQMLIKPKKTNNKGKAFDLEELRKAVKSVQQKRHYYHRNELLGKIEEKYAHIVQVSHNCCCFFHFLILYTYFRYFPNSY
jgi:hypothetical protein